MAARSWQFMAGDTRLPGLALLALLSLALVFLRGTSDERKAVRVVSFSAGTIEPASDWLPAYAPLAMDAETCFAERSGAEHADYLSGAPARAARNNARDSSSRWHCRGEHVFNRTCYYENVCMDPRSGEFVVFSPHGHVPPEVAVDPFLQAHNGVFAPRLSAAARSPARGAALWLDARRLVVLFDFLEPSVHAHVLADGLYSLFNLLVEAGLLAGDPADDAASARMRDALMWLAAAGRERMQGNATHELVRTVLAWLSSSRVHDRTDVASAARGPADASLVCFEALAAGSGGMTLWRNERWCNLNHRSFPPALHAACERARADVYFDMLRRALGVDASGLAAPRHARPLRITLVLRENNRRFVNARDVTDALVAAFPPSGGFAVQSVAWERVGSLADQVRLASQTDVYIAHDGSSLLNYLFLRPGAAFVRIVSRYAELSACTFDALGTMRGTYNFTFVERRGTFQQPPFAGMRASSYDELVRDYARRAAAEAWAGGTVYFALLGPLGVFQVDMVLDAPRLVRLVRRAVALVRTAAPSADEWQREPHVHFSAADWVSLVDPFPYGWLHRSLPAPGQAPRP